MNGITKAFLVLLCSILLFACQKDESNPQGTTGGGAGTKIDISVNTLTIGFGPQSVSTSSSKSTTIANPSSSNAELTGSVAVLGDFFSLASGGPSYRLLPGASITITITYRPLAVGNHTGSVSIQHNVPTKSSPIVIPLSGLCR